MKQASIVVMTATIIFLSSYSTDTKAQAIPAQQYRLRQIMLTPSISAERDTEVLGKAEKCLVKAKAGSDFTTLAKALSEEPGASHTGGDLGFFEHKSMVKAFSDKVYSMKPGEIAGPVKTQFGYHIIKLHGIKGEKRHAQHILFMLTPGKSDSLKTMNDLTKARSRILKGEDFTTVIKDYPVDKLVSETEGYMVWQSPENLLPSFADAIKGLKRGDISKPFASIIGFHIVQLDSINYDSKKTFEGFPAAIEKKLKKK